MKWVWASLVVAVFSTVAMGQQIRLAGRLISDEGKPVPNIRIRIADEQSAPTDKNGKFSIRLPPKLKEGERVVITLDNTLFVINQPLDGDWTIPATGTKSVQPLDVIVAGRASGAVWTGARIEKELKQKSDRSLDDLFNKYGSTPDVTKAAFEKWASTQNGIGNSLREQSTRAEGPEAARLLGAAASAYRRTLLVLTRDSLPQDWATTQHSLGYVLQELGVRATGPEAIRLIREGVAAYREALTVRTREQLPLQWAMTQNDLGNALQAQGARSEGAEARRLLAEATAAYRQALLVFTREYVPQEWAKTQHNLGSALQEQGTRTQGPEGQRLLGEAIAAYRQALLVRTREQLPRQWAITQNNLGNALQAQGTKAEPSESLRLFGEALVAYREALLVLTREQTPALWAMTKHNVGSALQEEGARTDGPEAQRLFGEAVAAYREALLVWTPAQRPQQWAMAQNNLARAYYNLKEWPSAAECYENVLAVYPEFRPAYERARFLEHEVLFNYPRAFKLNESWLQRNPDDLFAAATFAENHFTTGSFDECRRRISTLLSDVKFEAKIKIPVRVLEIANLIALNRSAEVPSKIKNLVEALESQPVDFQVEWSFAGIKRFISQSEQFAANRVWLMGLFGAIGGENRDAIIKNLRVLKT
ncbi:MAG TPA: tetratricopeptide repeat protein [Pyrinomonadaceae bacterium]|nr:tetratricopeptide repeat protein [Pyrinomonadaceae bacterium]